LINNRHNQFQRQPKIAAIFKTMTATALTLAKYLMDNPAIKKQGLYIDVVFNPKQTIEIDYRYKDLTRLASSVNLESANIEKGTNILKGNLIATFAGTDKEKNKGDCLDAYVVEYSATNIKGGYGRLLYYIAMSLVGDAGITADRVLSSADAVGAWNNLYADPEVKKLPLDDFYNPKTESTKDDCNMSSSGIYGEPEDEPEDEEKKQQAFHSLRSHDWNPKLSGKESQEYKTQKASKTNYVYYGNSQDAIDFLIKNNIEIILNDNPIGGPVNEHKLLLETLVYKKLLRKLFQK